MSPKSENRELLFAMLKAKITTSLQQFKLLSSSMYYMTGDNQFKENIELATELCEPIENDEIETTEENIAIMSRLAGQMQG